MVGPRILGHHGFRWTLGLRGDPAREDTICLALGEALIGIGPSAV